MNKNVFDLLKEQYLPDVEYTFDFCSKLTNKILEKYPSAHFEVGDYQSSRVSVIVDNGKYTIALHADAYSGESSAPAVSVQISAPIKPRESTNPYLGHINVQVNNHDRFPTCYNLLWGSINRYSKSIHHNVNDNVSEHGEIIGFLKACVEAVDKEMDPNGKEIKIITFGKDDRVYDEYDD